MKTKSSNIWKYFDEESVEKAKCKICNKIYARSGFATSGLIQHLKKEHIEQFKEFQNLKRKNTENENTFATTAKRQPTVEEAFDGKTVWSYNHAKSIEMDKLVAEMIALQSLPFNFVEGIGIRRVLHAALPRYKVRGREYFTTLLCGDLYERMANKIKSFLNDFDHVSLTTDVWSDTSAGVSLLSLTVQAISTSMKTQNIILKCEPIEGSHTGLLIGEKIENMLDEWNIGGKVHCVVHDRGSNMIRAMSLLQVGHINCAVHQLQLCIKSAIFENEDICKIINNAKKICGHFNHSLLAQAELEKIQTERLGQSPLKVVQDCPTRWNSTLYMLERLTKIKDSIAIYITTKTNFAVTADEWTVMENCVSILKPFEELTKQFSSKTTTIASVIPLVKALKTSLNDEKSNANTDFLKKLIDKLLFEIVKKFGHINEDKFYTTATYLDPRYKKKVFNNEEYYLVKNNIISFLNQNQDVQLVKNNPVSESASKKNFSNLQNCLSDLLESDSDSDENPEAEGTNRWILLLSEYNKEKTIKHFEDPLQWWNNNKVKYKELIPLVRQYLSTPPSSVSSEQLFGGAGLIYDPLRNKLESEKAAKLLFMKYNLKLLDFQY